MGSDAIEMCGADYRSSHAALLSGVIAIPRHIEKRSTHKYKHTLLSKSSEPPRYKDIYIDSYLPTVLRQHFNDHGTNSNS